MKVYQADCDCGYTGRYPKWHGARTALAKHRCRRKPLDMTPRFQCSSCGGLFPLLVDDALCIRCDVLHYPTITIGAPAPIATGGVPPIQLKEVA